MSHGLPAGVVSTISITIGHSLDSLLSTESFLSRTVIVKSQHVKGKIKVFRFGVFSEKS